MEIDLVYNLGAFRFAHDSDKENCKYFKTGEVYTFKARKIRNYKFHKKFFALVNLGFHNSKTGINDFEDYRSFALMRSGFVREVKTNRGVFHMPESISFAKMDEIKFEQVFSRVLQFIIQDTGADESDILDELINFM